MKLLNSLCVTMLIATTLPTYSADPAWWATRGVKTTAPASNLAVASVGQAKHMAALALAEIDGRIPVPEFIELESDVRAVVDLSIPAPLPSDWNERHRFPLLTGELKALAVPFYYNLRLIDPLWLDFQMTLAGIRIQEPGINPVTYSPYPWTESTADDANKAACTVGQLKAVFSIDFSQLAPAVHADRDSDGTQDKSDAFPDDPTRHLPPPSDPMDTTDPVITLTVPEGATAL
jgi:hypothetical protein